MRNIWILLKNYLLCGIGNLRRKNSRSKTVMGIVGIAVLYGIFFALMQMFMLFMAKTSAQPLPGSDEPSGLINSVLAIGLIISVFMAVVFALQKITGGKKADDTELLLSMPFKKVEIMVAKALSSFAFNFAFVTLFYLPSVIAYLAYTPYNLMAIIGCFVVMLLIPLMAVGLSTIVDFFVTVCFSNSKFGNISKALFTLITLVAVIVVYEFFALNLEDPNIMFNVVNWIITFNPIVFIPLSSAIVGLFILGCWLNSVLLNRESRSTQFKSTKIGKKVSTPLKSLLKNETNRYFNSPTLMINTLLGPLAMLCLTGWLVFDKGQKFVPLLTAFGLSDSVIYLFIGIIFAFAAVLTYPAAVSISIEGKQLWILRSMPISASTVLTAKALFNIILLVPVTLICGIVLQIVLKLSLINFIIMMTIPVLTAIMVSYTGVFINLLFPKFDFESEHLLIKQSISGFILMFGGMLIIFALAGITVWLLFTLPILTIALILIGLLTAITAVMMILTYTVGKRIFNRL